MSTQDLPAPEPTATEDEARATDPEAGFERYIRELLSSIQRHVRKARHGSEGAIHELRVDFKRLRAALSSLRTLDPDGHVREAARPVRRLFAVAAPLRDIQVHRALFARHVGGGAHELPEWIHALTARDLSARLQFLKVSATWSPSALELVEAVQRATSSVSEAELEWQARFAFAAAASRLADLPQERTLHDVDWHRVRRISKDARYLLALVNALSEPGSEWDALDLALRDVHQSLGGWHDALVVAKDLQAFRDGRGELPLRHPEAYDAYAQRLAESAQDHTERFHGAWSRLLLVLGVAEQ